MILSLRASTSRLVSALPLTQVRHVTSNRTFHPNRFAKTPQELLERIGRDAPKKLGEKASTWEDLTELFKKGTEPMKEAGISVKDRKYYMSCLWRFSNGDRPWLWVRKPKPPKKYRRWGPRIQHGVRVFSKSGERLVQTGQ